MALLDVCLFEDLGESDLSAHFHLFHPLQIPLFLVFMEVDWVGGGVDAVLCGASAAWLGVLCFPPALDSIVRRTIRTATGLCRRRESFSCMVPLSDLP